MQVHSLMDSFNYALEGIVHTFKTQRNMKIHFVIAFLVLFGSLFLDISKVEFILILFSIGFVIAMELVNTAIEVIIDMISEKYHFQAKIAKNMAAGAVLIAAINSVVLAYLIFFDDLRSLSLSLVNQIKKEPSHLIFINLALLGIIIISLKANQGKGTPLKGGMPSGHSAISFSLATMITIMTENIIVAILVFLLAFLVVQSRLENKTHNLVEVITGAIIGILLSIIIFIFLKDRILTIKPCCFVYLLK